MSELAELVLEQNKKIDSLLHQVHHLTVLVMKDKVDTTWVAEDTAAQMLGLAPRTFRRYVKTRQQQFAGIKYRNTNGRNWQYSRKDILNFKNLTSTL